MLLQQRFSGRGFAVSPRRRSPSPTGKVAGPMALTDEGNPALPKNRAKMNGRARRGGYQPPERYVA